MTANLGVCFGVDELKRMGQRAPSLPIGLGSAASAFDVELITGKLQELRGRRFAAKPRKTCNSRRFETFSGLARRVPPCIYAAGYREIAKRLASVPWAVLCIACQEAAGRMASDSQDEDEQPFRNAA